jgi:hypothetical protein
VGGLPSLPSWTPARELPSGSEEGAVTYTVIPIDPATGAKNIDFWNLSFDVYPSIRGASTETMLVQSLLIAYFAEPGAPVTPGRAKAQKIIASFGKGFAFADGIYGKATREVMRLFEEDMAAPVPDGIVRHVPDDRIKRMTAPHTKLQRLNFVWDRTMLGGAAAATKEASGRLSLPRVLFEDLYSVVMTL